MPEHGGAAWPAQEARAVDHIRDALLDGLKQVGVVARVVLQVGVLDEHDLALRSLDPGADGAPFPQVLLVQQDAHTLPAVQGGEQVAGAVGRAVVHQQDLGGAPGGLHPPDDLVEAVLLVVDGDDDRKVHGGHYKRKASAIFRPAIGSIIGMHAGQNSCRRNPTQSLCRMG